MVIAVVVGLLVVGDDDEDGESSTAGQDGGDQGSTTQAQVGNQCKAQLPPELQLLECGYSWFPGGMADEAYQMSVGIVIQNMSSESLSQVSLDITGYDVAGAEVRVGLASVGLLRPGERVGLGNNSLAWSDEEIERVEVSYGGPPLSAAMPDLIPSGVPVTSNVEIEQGVELQLGEEGTRVTYTVKSSMDRRVQVEQHVLLRDEDGAIIGHATGGMTSMFPEQTVDGEVETTIPNIADVEVYPTTSTALP